MASLLDRMRAWLRSTWAVPAAERAYRASVLAILAFGLGLRWAGYLTNPASLWMDEATWARRMITRSIFEHRFRPIGFMAIEKALVSVFGPSEFWLRFLSNAASVVVLLLIPYVASRLLKRRLSRLLLIFLFAAHPAAIDLAKEFKPYSLELLIHLLPIVIYLRYRQTERPLYFYLLLAAVPLSFLFAYNIAFAWPGILLIALIEGYRRFGRRGALAAVASGAVAVGLVVATYFTLLRDIATNEDEKYWGEKYDVFYSPKVAQQKATAAKLAAREEGDDDEVLAEPVAQTRLGWLLEKSGDMAGLPGLRRERWRPPEQLTSVAAHLTAIERIFWIALHVVAMTWWGARRKYEELLLFLMPVAVVVVCNILGQWPIGAFRTNLFLCVYTMIMAVCGLDLLIGHGTDAGGSPKPRLLAPWLAGGTLLALTVIPGFAFGFDWHQRKQTWTRHHQQREMLAWLRNQREAQLRAEPNRERDLLLMDAHTFPSHDFYLDFHPQIGPRHKAFFKANFKQVNQWALESRIRRGDLKRHLAANKNPIWMVISKRISIDPVRKKVAQTAVILLEHRFGPDHLVMLVNERKGRDGAR